MAAGTAGGSGGARLGSNPAASGGAGHQGRAGQRRQGQGSARIISWGRQSRASVGDGWIVAGLPPNIYLDPAFDAGAETMMEIVQNKPSPVLVD